MAWVVGVLLAVVAGVFATALGLDRDRAFYPTVMIVIALIYGLFALVGGSPATLVHEAPAIAGFVGLAVLGFKRSPWIIVAALAGHGLFDHFHGHLVANPGVPAWWPAFCMAYDVTAAGWLAGLILSGRMTARI